MVRLQELARSVNARGGIGRRRAEYLAQIEPLLSVSLGDEVSRRDFPATDVLLRRLVATGARPGTAHFFQGELYRLRGLSEDGQRAIGAYRQALEFSDAPPQTLRNLGLLLVRSDDRAGARSALERYLELVPDAEDREMVKVRLGHIEEVAR